MLHGDTLAVVFAGELVGTANSTRETGNSGWLLLKGLSTGGVVGG